VRRLAGELASVYGQSDGDLVLVAVLKGSVMFLADLARAMATFAPQLSPMFDFMAISSYAPDSGRVRILKDLDVDVYDRHVVLVEDIVDTGLSLNFLLGVLRRRQARSVEACVLLDKTARRIIPTPVRFRGFEIGDEFALGYGLDYAGRYRNLDRVVAGDLGRLRADPDAYVSELYAR
jgi:hypoxanthine phosphoribosyltransferase